MKKIICFLLLSVSCIVAKSQTHFYDTSQVVISIPLQQIKIPNQGANADSITVSVRFLVVDTLGSPLLTLKVRQIYKEPNPLPANFPADIAAKTYIWTRQVFPTLNSLPKTIPR
jgi:hypothetical protein